MRLGKLLYQYFFKPTLALRYNLSHFGFTGWLKYRAGESSMKRAAAKETPVTLTNDENAITLCFLTGKNYWHQTVYVIKSLSLHLNAKFRVKIFSDGTLTDAHWAILNKFAPNMVYVSPQTVDGYLAAKLPEEKFPALRFLRNYHPFFKRMIDVHCWPGWAIHMDSDMLFFDQPETILKAHSIKSALYMQDAMDASYFVDDENALKAKYDIDCLPRVNGGIIAYDSDKVDYNDLERKAQLLIDNYLSTGPARIEQTLMSYLLYKQNAQALDQNEYAIYYDSELASSSDQVVRHYIYKAKLPYFTREWKNIAH